MNAYLWTCWMALVLVCTPGIATTIQSECADPIFIFFSGGEGGGADSLTSSSWSRKISRGWTRLGPYQSTELPAGYHAVRIELNQVPLTITSHTDKNVEWNCYSPTEGKTFRLNWHGLPDSSAPVKKCYNEGGLWTSFERISQYGKYIVYQNSCKKGALPPPANVTRHHWQSGPMHFVRTGQSTWRMVTSQDYEFYERKIDADSILLRRNGNPLDFFLLKNDAVWHTPNAQTPWSKLSDGGWAR